MKLRLLIISILLAGYIYPQNFDWDWFSKKKETGVFTPVFAGDTTFPFNSIYDSGYVSFGENGHYFDFMRMAGVFKPITGVRSVTDTLIWTFKMKVPTNGFSDVAYNFEYGETSAWVISYYAPASLGIYLRAQGWRVWTTSVDTNWHTYRGVYKNTDSTLKLYCDGTLCNSYTGVIYNPIAVTIPLQFNAHNLGFGETGESAGLVFNDLYTGKFMCAYFNIDKWYSGVDSASHWNFNVAGQYIYNYYTFSISDRDAMADTTMHFGQLGFSRYEIDSCDPAQHLSVLKTGYEDIVFQAETGTHTWIPLTTGQYNCFTETYTLRGDTMTINDTLNVLMCGAFNRVNATIPPYTHNGDTVASCVRWNGQAMVRMGKANFFTNVVYKVGHWGDTIYAGGALAGQRLVQYKPNAVDWVSVGTEPNNDVYAMFVDTTDNTLIIGGLFTTAGGLGIARIAKWNGSAYDTMGAMNSPVWNINRYNGSIYAGTSNGLKKYNGTTWEECGGNGYGVVYNTAVYQGKLWCFGNFLATGGTTQAYDIWNGTAFEHPAGTGATGFVQHITWSSVAPNGRDLYVVGSFYRINGVVCNKIARWNGREWSAVVMGGMNLRGESCFMWKDRYNNLGQGANYYYMSVMGDQLVIANEDCHGIGLIKIPQDVP